MKKHITAFYFETLLMILVFVAMILVLSGVFGGARARSAEARHLTKAVDIAGSAAEAVAASKSPEELERTLGALGETTREDGKLTLREGEYLTEVTWEPEGELAESVITVFWDGREVYSLATAVFTGEGGD